MKPLYEECSLTVAPVAFGAGTSIKVLESFAYSRTCVMNYHASRGLEDLPAELRECLIANSIAEMSDLIEGVLQEKHRIGRQCYGWICENRSVSQFNVQVTRALSESVNTSNR